MNKQDKSFVYGSNYYKSKTRTGLYFILSDEHVSNSQFDEKVVMHFSITPVFLGQDLGRIRRYVAFSYYVYNELDRNQVTDFYWQHIKSLMLSIERDILNNMLPVSKRIVEKYAAGKEHELPNPLRELGVNGIWFPENQVEKNSPSKSTVFIGWISNKVLKPLSLLAKKIFKLT